MSEAAAFQFIFQVSIKNLFSLNNVRKSGTKDFSIDGQCSVASLLHGGLRLLYSQKVDERVSFGLPIIVLWDAGTLKPFTPLEMVLQRSLVIISISGKAYEIQCVAALDNIVVR